MSKRLFGQNISDAIKTLKGDETEETAGPLTGCVHCWHQWGSASGSVGADGSTTLSGVNRCCFCGLCLPYDIRTGPRPPRSHGSYLLDIQRSQL